MRLKKVLQRLTALLLLLSVTVACYATDLDRVFGIRASAASYEDRATSMIQFYKEGARLDRKSVSNDELYVFGVFVSNFLMPFQSNVGYMSSDSFVTKMAQTFFGDAYTAQQYSDMKYTLGLVQSAQNSRSKLLEVNTNAPCSFDTIYRNFGGFYAPTQSPASAEGAATTDPSLLGDPVLYTYEGATNKQVVWQSKSDIFDAIVGQLISICPSQAGVYMGTAGKPTSALWIDCFGNISDNEGIVIVPACMNPYAFYNHYLDASRNPVASPDNTSCPLQLPINNAFWMGTMVTPQDLTSRAKSEIFVTENNASSTTTDEPSSDEPTEEAGVYLIVEYGGGGIHNQLMSNLSSDSSQTFLEKQDGKWGVLDTAIDAKTGWSTVCKIKLEKDEEFCKLEGHEVVKDAESEPQTAFDYMIPGGIIPLSSDDDAGYGYFACTSTAAIADSATQISLRHPSAENPSDSITGALSKVENDAKTGFLSSSDNINFLEGSSLNVAFGYYNTDKFCEYYNIKAMTEADPYLPGFVGDFILSTLANPDGSKSSAGVLYTLRYWTGSYDASGEARIETFALGTANELFRAQRDLAVSDEAKNNYYTAVGADIKPLVASFNNVSGYAGCHDPYGNWRISVKEISSSGSQGTIGSTQADKQYTYGLKRTLIALPNLYMPVQKWTDSTTALVGISTMDGNELGIYFDPAIQARFMASWKVAANAANPDAKISEKTYQDFTTNYLKNGTYGYIDTWNFVGGTSVPISLVLDDIALFDTYNNFGESLMETIRPISMYTDTDGVWHAAKGHGTKIESIYASVISATTDALNADSSGNGVKAYYIGKILNARMKGNVTYTPNAAENTIIELGNMLDNDTFNVLDNFFDASKTSGSGTDNSTALLEKLTELINNVDTSSTDNTYGKFTATNSNATTKLPNSISGTINEVKKALKDSLKDVAWTSAMDSENWKDLAIRAVCAVCIGDPCWLTCSNSPLVKNIALYSNSDVVDTSATTSTNGDDINKALTAMGGKDADGHDITGIPNFEAKTATDGLAGAFNEVIYLNHTFLQKAHPAMPNTTTLTGGGNAFLKVLAGIVAVIAIVAVAVVAIVTTVLSGGAAAPAWVAAVASIATKVAVCAIAVEVALLSGIAVADITRYNSLSAQKEALSAYYSAVYNKCYGYEQVKAAKATDGLNLVGSNANAESALDAQKGQNPMITDLLVSYGWDGKAKLDSDAKPTADKPQAHISNAYVLDYTLYSPYGSLASALGAVAQVQTQQGIVDGDRIYDKVGSFITVDVNLWGGIYYAYMVDIFGLTVDKDGVMSCAQLKTNFPPIPDELTATTNPDLSALFNEGDKIDSEEEETQKRRELLARMDEMTDVNATDYVGNWMTNTINSWVLKTHASICGASESGSISNIGGGTQYTGYSGYLATATLSEMPFTSWVMEYYNIIYLVLLALVLIAAICMLVTGHRTARKTIFTAALMALVLFLPKLTLDTVVTTSNIVAQDVYKDRFNFWAYAQYQQYIAELSDAEEKKDEIEFLIVTNIQQAKDYYSEDKGVTLKWMSPKKTSYWDQLNGITGGSEDGLNLSIFKWMFQGQFRQEQYSTDNMATYLYRPFNDISMTARTYLQKHRGGDVGSSAYESVLKSNPSYTEVCEREAILYRTSLGNAAYMNTNSVDTDISPAYLYKTNGNTAIYRLPSYTASGTISGVPWYATGLANASVNKVAFNRETFVKLDYSQGTDTAYAAVYPSTKQGGSLANSAEVGISQDLTGAMSSDPNLNLFYLYNESPYYYFYFMFQDMADRFATDPGTGAGSMRKLLLCENYFKYTADVNNGSSMAQGFTTKGNVDEGAMMDYLDLQGLFTYVIPYLHQSNQYVAEWTDLWGTTPSNDVNDPFNTELKHIWNMYSPWVDAMYSTSYAEGTMRVGGKGYAIQDAINPGSYSLKSDIKDARPMMFSEAQMQRNWTVKADLTEVEKRIQQTLEDTYTDLMYLNNYTTFDDDVLLSAAAMIATFNFNQNFSDTPILGKDVTLYPTGFEVKNFSYDSYMRLALLNTTGESVFSEEDIYTTVIKKSSFFTGLLILLNDLIAVYAIPAMKLVLLLGLFFLGLIVCVGSYLSPPNDILKFIAKNFLLPLGIFAGILLGNTLIASLFVGEGITSQVGQRGVTITTGDPTVTILLMLAVNVLVLWGFFKTLKLLLKSFKISLTWLGTMSSGLALAVAGAASIAHRGASKITGFVGRGGRRGDYRGGSGSSKYASDPDDPANAATSRATARGKSKTEPKKRFNGKSANGEFSREDAKQAMQDVTSGRKSFTRTGADGSTTTVTQGTTRAERKAARKADKMMTAEDKHAMRKYKQDEAKKWSEQRSERKAVSKLVEDSFGEDYNKATQAKKEVMTKMAQSKKEHRANYKLGRDKAKSELKSGIITKDQYKQRVSELNNRRKADKTQYQQISKKAKTRYKDRINTISDKQSKAVQAELEKQGLMSQKHDKQYLRDYQDLARAEHKDRKKTIAQSKSTRITRKDKDGKVVSEMSYGRFADTKMAQKLNQGTTRAAAKAKTALKGTQAYRNASKMTKQAKNLGSSALATGRGAARDVKARKRAILSNIKRGLNK